MFGNNVLAAKKKSYFPTAINRDGMGTPKEWKGLIPEI